MGRWGGGGAGGGGAQTIFDADSIELLLLADDTSYLKEAYGAAFAAVVVFKWCCFALISH